MLAAVQAVLADVQEGARHLISASTDTLEGVHSDVVGDRPRNEPVYGVEIETAIVVVVEELG